MEICRVKCVLFYIGMELKSSTLLLGLTASCYPITILIPPFSRSVNCIEPEKTCRIRSEMHDDY